MKHLLTSLALLSIGISTAFAEIPKKAPLYNYARLWTDSPFTSKPPVVSGAPVANPLDDFTLTGIAPVPGGYRVTIISKKDPTVKQVIAPGGKSPFRVISVNSSPGKTLETSVVLSNGTMQGTVSFEPDLLTINAPPAAAPPPNEKQPENPNPAAAQPNAATGQTAGPRPRIVVPPKTSNNNNGGNNNQNKNQRPDRR